MQPPSKASGNMLKKSPSFDRAKGSATAAWVLGCTLMLLLVAIVFICPEPSLFQQGVVRVLVALTGALLSYHFAGQLTLTIRPHKSIVVSGSSGFAVFILLLSVINPFDAKTTLANFAPLVLPQDKTIIQVQQALKVRGLYDGDITGRPDSTTRNAIKQFQSVSHLPVDGFADSVTVRKLADGSESEVRSSNTYNLLPDPLVKRPLTSGVASDSASRSGREMLRRAQLSYSEAGVEITVVHDGSGSEEMQITFSVRIQNDGNDAVRIALMKGMSLQLDTGLSFTRPVQDVAGVSGISYCDSASEIVCMKESKAMALLRPNGTLRVQIRFLEPGQASMLDAARSGRFSGRLYTQTNIRGTKSIQPIELDEVDLLYVTSPRFDTEADRPSAL